MNEEKKQNGENCWAIAYRGESKNRLKFLCLPEFQSHYFLRLLLLRVNYIQLQRKNNNLHGLTIKTKRIFGLKLGKIQSNSIMKGAGIEPATSSTEVRWLNHCDTALMNKYKLKHLTIDGSKSLLTISRLCFKMLSLSLSWISCHYGNQDLIVGKRFLSIIVIFILGSEDMVSIQML